MITYPKIETVWKRDEGTHKLIDGAWRTPEFEYLAGNRWIGTEKVDGTNIRVTFNAWSQNEPMIQGRTDKAQIPPFLLARLQELFTREKMLMSIPETELTLYGEGYGAKIRKGGGNYIPSGVDFILFDVRVKDWWLRRDSIEDVAETLDIKVVPIVYEGNLEGAIRKTRVGMQSAFGPFTAEGMVLKPAIPLHTRRGDRIITKVKTRDF